jgi:hypothetical protein
MVVLGFSIVLFGLLVRSGVVNIANKDQSITVSGTAEKVVDSDKAKVSISISERAYGGNASQEANRNLGVSVDKIKKYLITKGVKVEEITTQGNSLSQICEIGAQGYENCSLGVKGQNAYTSVIVETENVDLAKNISEKIGSDLSLNITNASVEYFYSKLKDIRVEMLAEATRNARERALAVGEAGGASIGSITSLSSGVFQVTAENSVDVDGYGAYDTSAIRKKITATVKVNFAVK